jgi:hypothetical protein
MQRLPSTTSATGLALFLSLIALVNFTGCEKAEPTSYLIPKEERTVSMPGAADASKQAPVNNPGPGPGMAGSGQMQVLPGMQESANEAGEVTYTVPEGWEEVPPSGIRKANLIVNDENGRAELTVLVFPGDVGGRLANINRWREQIGLPPAQPEELPAFTESYTISRHGGLYVRLEGGAQSILGALLPFHGFTWFFKFQGSSGTVLANEAGMKAFLDSVQLEDNHH